MGNCILINTLFFKSGWIFPFDPAETRQENFYPVSGKKHPVSMMHLSDQWFAFHKAELFEMATLPYGNDSYAMTVILPKKGVSIDSCIATFSEANWKAWLSASDSISCMLDLKLPSINWITNPTSFLPSRKWASMMLLMQIVQTFHV